MFSLKVCFAGLAFALFCSTSVSAGDEAASHLSRRSNSLLSERDIIAASSPLTRSLGTDAAARVRLAKTRAARKAKRDAIVALLDKRTTPAEARAKLVKTKAVAAAKAEVAKKAAALKLAEEKTKASKAAKKAAQKAAAKAKAAAAKAQSATPVAIVAPVVVAAPGVSTPVVSTSVVAAPVVAAPIASAPVVPAPVVVAASSAPAAASPSTKAFGGATLSAYATYIGTKCARDKNCVAAEIAANLPSNGAAVCDQTTRHCVISCASNYLLNNAGTCIKNAVGCPSLSHGTYSRDSAGVCQPTCDTAIGYTLSTSSSGVAKCTNTASGVANCGALGNHCAPSYNGIGFAKCFFSVCTLQCPVGYFVRWTTDLHPTQKYYCA